MSKPMNMKRRLQELESRDACKSGSPIVLEMILSFRNRRHEDKKKAHSKSACRRRVEW
jgi:hypothetical protein